MQVSRRMAIRGAAAASALVLAGGGYAIAASVAKASPSTSACVTNQPHYRHGFVPVKGCNVTGSGPYATALKYGGGIDGTGVTTGHEKVYLVFWGSQWGTQSWDNSGDVHLGGDPNSAGPYLQEMFKGLGTTGDTWSGVMTQYCDGVQVGSARCSALSNQHVAYPDGGALAGVWVDESSAAPYQATANQIGTEAVSAAAHFGNTDAASNRDAQYVILSPTGTHPDGFNTPTGGFCAWHDYNGDPYVGVSSPYGDIAFTNMPYVTDMTWQCGEGFVNSPGTLDGFSIVNGHEYAETVTDQNPAGGWTDTSGAENGDKCAWIQPGTTGGAFNLTDATGSYAMQTTWSNDARTFSNAACEASHPIMRNS